MPGDVALSDLPLLMAVRVQGISSVERAAAALGTDAAGAQARLHALIRAELATERSGRLAGFTLSPAGLQALDELLASEGLAGDAQLCECYERFMQLNPRVLKVVTDWQVRRERGAEVPNDHSDAAYDHSVIDRLIELHDRARVCLRKIAGCAPRFERYLDRLESCVRRVESGHRGAVAALLSESYHTVWFELHQDLLLTLGREREE